jgi:hypothetical protein
MAVGKKNNVPHEVPQVPSNAELERIAQENAEKALKQAPKAQPPKKG